MNKFRIAAHWLFLVLNAPARFVVDFEGAGKLSRLRSEGFEESDICGQAVRARVRFPRSKRLALFRRV